MSSQYSVLLVDDDEDTRTLMTESLRRRGLNVDAVASADACLEWMRTHDVDVVVTDLQMPNITGVQLCEILTQRHPNVLTLLLTGAGSLDAAIGAVRAGAYDYLSKPVKTDVLDVALKRAFEHISVKREVRRLKASAGAYAPIPGLIGDSPALREVTATVRNVADSDATVLITGESGTGKELVARALHDLSRRRNEPFVAINCGAVPPNLLESELFGHVRGAFTDAKSGRPGLFAQAGAGTIFLDEIGEMPLEMQVKLLRVLQERRVRPVGGDEEVAFEARVVAATNRDLETEVDEKRFREDLFYRLNVVAIPVPPLRERRTDILVLARHLLDRIAKRTSKPVPELGADAARKMLDYNWPGNVRELENCIERSVAMTNGQPIAVANLPTKIQQYEPARLELTTNSGLPDEMISLEEMERRYVLQVLGSVAGNKTHAARILGIDRRSLYRRLDPQTAKIPPA